MSDNNLQNKFGKRQELGVMPDFQTNLRNSDNQQFKQEQRISHNSSLLDNGYPQMINEAYPSPKRINSGGLRAQTEGEQAQNMFNNQYTSQMPITINGPTPTPNQFTNRAFQQNVQPKMINQEQQFASHQMQQDLIAQMQQDFVAQIAEIKKEIEELKNDSLKKEEDIKTLFRSSEKSQSSSLNIQTDEDDEYKIFAPIPQKSELQAELQDLLMLQAQHNGSDMHLKVGAAPMIRIEGELVPVGEEPLTSTDVRRLLLPLLSKKQKTKLVQDGQLDFSFQIEQGRFRTNIYLQKGTLSAAMRLVKTTIPTLEELGIPESINKALSFTSGLFLLTGPTGSGKSTSMAAMVEYLNLNAKYHIVTLEDPIEYVFQDKESLISQREVGIDTVSYGEGMRAVLRQDPDVILLGELRDHETISQALKAAETGHLVISTLHSSNAIQTISRIIDMFQPSERMIICSSLATTLCGILSHKLIPSIDMERRILIPELMYVTPTIASLIRANSYHEIYQYIQEGTSDGMITFNQSFVQKIREGVISEEAALAYAEEPNELNLMIREQLG